MDSSRLLTCVIIGVLMGVAIGYLHWAQENARLTRELVKTRAWLLDEIRREDAPRDQSAIDPESVPVARQTLQADLDKVRSDLRATKAVLSECVGDWRSERERRRILEDRLAIKQREVASPGVAAGAHRGDGTPAESTRPPAPTPLAGQGPVMADPSRGHSP